MNGIQCRLVLSLVLLGALVEPVASQNVRSPEDVLADKSYVQPASTISEMVLAPRWLNATLDEVSPDRRGFLQEIGDGPVTMDRFSKPFDELGGVFVDWQANRHRDLTIRSGVGIRILSAEGDTTELDVPSGARVSNATWSPDGSRVAFYVHTADATHIWVADATTGQSRQLTRRPVLATMVTGFEWTRNGSEIATVLVPEGRAPRPLPPTIPTGPQVKQTEEGENMLRTYASLMATPYDEELLEWHATGQLAVLDVDSRGVTEIGEPTMITSFDFSPAGAYARVEIMQKPFSYIVPVRSFGSVEEVWDRTGNTVVELERTETQTGIDGNLPTAPGVGGSEEEPDRRDLAWRADDAGLTFLQEEARDDDEETEGRGRPADRVMLWAPPFDEAGLSVVYESEDRISAHRFSEDHGMLFLTYRPRGGNGGNGGNGNGGGTVREVAVDLSDTSTTWTLAEYEADDFYADPGRLLETGGGVPQLQRRFGGGGSSAASLVQTSADGRYVWFYGNEYNEDPMLGSPVNFLDRVEIRTGEKERVYASNNDGQTARIVAVLDADGGVFVESRESPTEVAQAFRVEGGRRTQLTANVDYSPRMTAAPRQRFTVERPDGFRFLVNVTLPPGYEEGTRLPAMFWFYPREYTDQESYDERGRTYDKNEFPSYGTRSMQYLVQLGYAVVEPDAPIVGEAGQMNNNYEHDLRNNLAAVIDELDRRELIDRRRLGIGGHSYGSFSTANAMAHTPFFKAGIAGDGNFNRTLTPLMFQSERRVFWEAKDVYTRMSPFFYADEITGAMLIYHGMHDQNVGTALDHAPRMFHALNGLGKEAAMYLYPYEDHGPASRSTLLDLWGRWTAWLDLHLRDGETRPVTRP
jgi:dipeptidyl aminopeptidase/acylaminoacyl peptidase